MSGFRPDGTVDLQDLRVRLYDLLGHRYSPVSPSPAALILLQAANMLAAPKGLFHCRGRVRGVGFNGKRFSVQEVSADIGDEADELGFDGLIVSVSHALPIYGRTIVMPDRGALNPRHLDGMKRVAFPAGASDARFEVYADNQIEGRSLIPTRFTQHLLDFHRDLSTDLPSVAIAGHQMHIVLPTGDRMRFSEDLPFYKHTAAAEHVAGEISRVLDIVARVDALQSSADRYCPPETKKLQSDHYLATIQSVGPRVIAAMEAGIVTDRRRTKYLKREVAMIDSVAQDAVMSGA